MTVRPPFATFADIQTRHPAELAVLAMDEATRLVDPARVDADELDRVDDAGGRLLRLFAIDVAMYRLALPPRQTEAIRDRYAMAVARLKDLARGIGALTVTPAGGAVVLEPGVVSTGSPHEVLIEAPERLFTRRRYGGAG